VDPKDPKTRQLVGEFDDNPPNDVLHPFKFNTRTDDPKTRFVAPADGRYEVMVTSHTADLQFGPRYLYRLSIRREQPDFRLVLVDAVETPQIMGPAACNLSQGSSQAVQVFCFRHDGFAGEVTLTAEGLPPGVTCPPQTLGPNQRMTVLVFTAAADAPAWAGPITVKGTATIDGQPVVREARGGCLVWAIQPVGVPAVTRMARTICLAVREKATFTLEPTVKELAVPVGGNVPVKVALNVHNPEFKAPVQVQLLATAAPPNAPPPPPQAQLPAVATINPGTKEAEVRIQVPNNVVPGVYNLVLRGQAQAPVLKDSAGKPRPPVFIHEVAAPIKLTVFNTVATVSVDNPNLTLKPGTDTQLTVKVNRLHGYQGEFKVQLVLPQGFQGVQAAEITIPAGANEGKLTLKVPANAAPAANPNVLVRATAVVEKVTLNQEAKLAVTIAK
jgi:hypothetical protein